VQPEAPWSQREQRRETAGGFKGILWNIGKAERHRPTAGTPARKDSREITRLLRIQRRRAPRGNRGGDNKQQNIALPLNPCVLLANVCDSRTTLAKTDVTSGVANLELMATHSESSRNSLRHLLGANPASPRFKVFLGEGDVSSLFPPFIEIDDLIAFRECHGEFGWILADEPCLDFFYC
jgi:hypothetical protein